MADVKKTAEEREKEIIEWKNDILHALLDEFSKGKEIQTNQFIAFLLEYNDRPQYQPENKNTDDDGEATEATKKEKKRKEEEERRLDAEMQIDEIKGRLPPDKKMLTLLECMEYILEEVEVDENENEILKAFEVFDKARHSEIETGNLALSDIKSIMEQFGPLGYQLNEYEQSKFWRLLKDEFEYLNHIKTKVDIPTVEVIEYVNGARHVNFVKDKEIDYTAFTKKLIESVGQKDNRFREMKEKADNPDN